MAAEGPGGSRVAVIVVPGVGDDARGATVESVSAHLQTRGYRHGERHELLTAQHDEVDEAYSSVWVRLTRGDVPVGDGSAVSPSTVDIYEMRWSDLSRFPNRTAAFLLGAWGLVLQIPTLALEALRNLRDEENNPYHPENFPQTRTRAERLRRGFELLSWWLAVPLLLIPASLIGLIAAVWLSFNAYSTWLAVVGLFVLLGLCGAAAFVGGRKLRAGGWGVLRFDSLAEAKKAGGRQALRYGLYHPVYWAVGIVLAVAATFIAVLIGTRSGDDPTLAVVAANTTVLVSSYALRPVWLIASLIVFVTFVLIILMARTAKTEKQRLGGRARRTAVAALAIAPLGLAVVNAVALGLASGVLLRLSRSDTWSPEEQQDLRCLSDSRDWHPGPCTGDASDALVGMENWGRELFGQILAPAVIVAVLLLLLVVVPVAFFFHSFVPALVRKRSEDIQGSALGAALHNLGRFGPVLVGLAMVLSIVGVWLAWVPLGLPDLGLDTLIGVGGAYAVAAVLAVGLALGTTFLPKGGPFRVVWTVMDVIYDIAAYRRISHVKKTENPPEQPAPPESSRPSGADAASADGEGLKGELKLLAPREKMFARYTELIRYISEGRESVTYERIVILAHSQGCLVTVGALFGEPAWEKSALATQQVRDEERGQRWTLPPIFLVTCGNPISQLYRAMLPGSYDWVSNPDAPGPGPEWPVREWINLYRAGDYVGRALWSLEEVATPGYWSRETTYRRRGSIDAVTMERCIGRGMHTGYWSQDEILAELERMIDGRPLTAGVAGDETPGATT